MNGRHAFFSLKIYLQNFNKNMLKLHKTELFSSFRYQVIKEQKHIL